MTQTWIFVVLVRSSYCDTDQAKIALISKGVLDISGDSNNRWSNE